MMMACIHFSFVLSLLILAERCSLAYSKSVGCGRPSSFYVIGGSSARSGQWPWQVSIQTYQMHYCGGSLIDPYTVLTAAHCISDDILKPEGRWTVVTGTHDLDTVRRGAPNIHKIRAVKKHELFNGSVHDGNDVAIIKLETPVIFDALSMPVCLPGDENDIVPVGTDCVLSGWGDIEPSGEKDVTILQFMHSTVITNSACEIPHRYHHKKVIHDGNVCAGGGVPQSSCHGDSGGPLSCYRGGRWVLDGIVSWGGIPCGKHQEPQVYTRVTSYLNWVENNRNI